ncbi:hypothetical protein Pla110_17010 [Polystyrenella longa]|uniref:DUF3500 domain-containing protein n=1 Tax=Polystyrenella longa TaxID=2528007 RepID=A0A518CL83_9PLAN|nr:DUF3500 domain-containing protein [Polystyrenella longa]QDU79979.1 hypothetical protein Pla110_17010 [Polystyrenella longa]
MTFKKNSKSIAPRENENELCFNRFSRRDFVKTLGVGAAASLLPNVITLAEETSTKQIPQVESEKLVAKLYESFTPEQKSSICFDWNHLKDGSPLRLRVANNWQITDKLVRSDFYTKDQQEMIEAIVFNIYSPEWRGKIRQEMNDDCGGFGEEHSIALFGDPAADKFEFVFAGRHLTVRCDGNTTENVAFGGPIFYGHDPHGEFNEPADHPDNVFWEQGIKANRLYEMLDGKQRAVALKQELPAEDQVHFRKAEEEIPGLRVSEMSADQQEHMELVLKSLVEPYRQTDQAEVLTCLKAQGGLENCRLTFYQPGDIGNDQVWDNWRLEGPAFVWHFRGAPHVHVWANVADDPSVKISTG